MLDYRLSFDIEVKNSDKEIEVLIISRKDVAVWKNKDGYSEVKAYNNSKGTRIHDAFRPSVSDAYAFILNNRSSQHEVKTVEVTLTHNWYQEIKESRLKDKTIDLDKV
jgi:hypothetical protein